MGWTQGCTSTCKRMSIGLGPAGAYLSFALREWSPSSADCMAIIYIIGNRELYILVIGNYMVLVIANERYQLFHVWNTDGVCKLGRSGKDAWNRLITAHTVFFFHM